MTRRFETGLNIQTLTSTAIFISKQYRYPLEELQILRIYIISDYIITLANTSGIVALP